MRINIIGRAIRIAAVAAAILPGSASCVKIDETLGGNLIPTDQIWNVFPHSPVRFRDEGIILDMSDSLSGYSTSRFTFGSIKDGDFSDNKSTSFTLVPLADSLDFGEDTKVIQFHLTAVRDTLSMLHDYDKRILQNVYVRPLIKPLDSTILYTGTELKKDYVKDELITKGIPVYNGSDSLSFDFSEAYALSVIDGIKGFQSMTSEQRDSLSNYLKHVPGIYIETDPATTDGGRINLFNLPIEASDGYIDGNYAELKIRAKYNGRETDTLFVFYFGPSEFLSEDATSYPAQFCFNMSDNTNNGFLEKWKSGTRENLYIEGGSGLKPVVKAVEIKRIVDSLLLEHEGEIDPDAVVINKATIMLPYNVGGAYEKLDRYPMILSPTVKLRSDDRKYVTYAGLTDASIETENQGDINRSLDMYCPDVSHHVQEIARLKQKEGETDAEFETRLEKYDIWFLIMHEEITVSSSTGSGYDDYYNNLLYNSYYNNMMYDPYGYGYGYGGYGGYGYGGYGYGYNNYYNYYMMAAYANASSSSTTTSSSIELDKDRFYNAVLNGPGSSGKKPSLKITFSAPKLSE